MPGVVYDTGALLAAERLNPDLIAFHEQSVDAGVLPLVPVLVLAQAWRGGPQPSLSRLLRGCRVQPDDEPLGRAAGAVCAAAGTSDVVDAIVVVTAVATSALVVTSDPGDIQRLADAIGVKLRTYQV